MEAKPLVAICVPVYNAEAYLERALDSLINQTYRNIVIICANDASTDGSADILEYYAQNDDRIKVITHEYNKGAGGGYNTCIDYALDNTNAEYICHLDNDDYCEPDMIAVFAETAVRTGADIVFANHWYFDNVETKLKRLSETVSYNTLTTLEETPSILEIDGYALWTKCIRADYARKARAEGVRFREVRGECYPDLGYFAKLAVHGAKFYYIDRAFVHYMIYTSSVTSKPKTLLPLIDEVNSIAEYYTARQLNGTAYAKAQAKFNILLFKGFIILYLNGNPPEELTTKLLAWQDRQVKSGNLKG
jgi:glycosyltransferase involved in cell wall biosynthesis